MRRLQAWLLPLLTVLTVLTVTLLPRHLLTMQDQKRMGQVHTEALTTENLLPTQPPDMTQRIELLVRWMETSDAMSAQQELSDDAIYTELTDALLDALARMAEGGVLPAELLPESIPFTEATQLYLQQQLTGAKYYILDTPIHTENAHLWAVLDGDTKQLLWLELVHPVMEDLFFDSLSPADIGTFFLESLGVENDLTAAEKFDAVFQTANPNVQYVVSLDPCSLKIAPMLLYPETDAESSSEP